MKAIALLLLLSATAFATSALPAFDPTPLATPELSLASALKAEPLPQTETELVAASTPKARVAYRERRYISRMPVREPQLVDRQMPIAAPDPTVDFKMLVVDPSVEAKK